MALLDKAQNGESALLIAPTGAGKTLAGFLPSLIDLEQPRNRSGLHTLYISPLKALAVDVARNLETPVAEMRLPVRIETRTGDTSASKRMRQRRNPPDILLTTPEQLALLLATADAQPLFSTLRRVVLDELHAIVTSKRGDLLALGLARLRTIAPAMTSVGLSATVRDPDELRRYLVAQNNGDTETELAALVTTPKGAEADIQMLDTRERLPWSGHSALHAMREIYAAIKAARMTLVFVNTRAQAEAVFQQLWTINDDNLTIALHHGSLDASQRRKVEAAMSAGLLKAVVCTSTLDLGIDWGDVDLVINVGAPKGASRIAQRIGRANHRLDEPSRALLVPANRFEVLECRAAIDAAKAGEQDTPPRRVGSLDVLCQHILGMACSGPFQADALYTEIRAAEPYSDLARQDFDDALDFVATGGYALKTYDRFAKIKQMKDGLWRVANPKVAQSYRMNVGTIVESDMLKVRLVRARAQQRAVVAPPSQSGAGGLWYPTRLQGDATRSAYTGPLARGGRVLGQIEEYFLETLAPGDTFLFGGEILALQGIVENEALVARARSDAPKVPSYAGGKFPLSTWLAQRVRQMLSNPRSWKTLPSQVSEWLKLQQHFSMLPPASDLLVETFPRGERYFMVAYPFEGRLAHQTLGMLLTRRMERLALKPMGFVANDYAIAIWSLSDVGAELASGQLSLSTLFNEDMLGDDLEEWLQESALMKRTFRNCAIVSGLIERRYPGKEKSGRQVTISTDLVYDVLRRHQPDHILLRAAREDALTGLLDLARLAGMLSRVRGRIVHKRLEHVSPLAVPVMLEIGREPIYGEAQEQVLKEAADDLIREAMS
ncbi:MULTISPECIES: ligase-associated DNA damage response DEXH box helicase [unclassified Beijerinckia]|uniref:ligase-associated DNA damage response DEXH box helicase n=1 Tax=unclassified Beijerinckia TaxID=2638183 RepID=UPI000ACDD2E5|nr:MULTISPECIES: ligase-associated DNA damage response DEXH box helicase [unclassified Beijerinckia]MDH7797354.1 ATP-dependent Lhr-like helicase [Beijerinckia sp. GAS462]